MVTYLVVLLQFQISIPTTDLRSSNRNITVSEDISMSDENSEEMEMDVMTTVMTTLATATTKLQPAKGRKG